MYTIFQFFLPALAAAGGQVMKIFPKERKGEGETATKVQHTLQFMYINFPERQLDQMSIHPIAYHTLLTSSLSTYTV